MSVLAPARASLAALREAVANEGIRRLELGWLLGIVGDTALLVTLLVAVYARDGAVGTGVLGAARMLPAVLSGMSAGATLERIRGERLLAGVGIVRAVAALLAAAVIAAGGPAALLYLFAAVAAAAGALVRPTQLTLMPALARSPGELVAANMAWSTGEGLGSFVGPLVAGGFLAIGMPAFGAVAAAAASLGAAAIVAGLRFEHAQDAGGGTRLGGRGVRLLDGLRTMRRRPIVGWTMLGVFAQVLTRGLLSSLAVVAAIELLGMGDAGVGALNAALGVGGLFGAVFAVSLARTDRLIRTEAAALAYWGAPIAVIGLLPFPPVALGAMVVVGIANATYDVALFTILQRGSANEERAPVFSVLEGTVGMGSVAGSLLAPALVVAFGPALALAIAGSILPVVALVVYGMSARAGEISVVDEGVVRLLRQVPAFEALPLTAVERLAAGLVPVAYEAGRELMRQGDPGDRFIVVDRGEVEVRVDGTPVQRLGHGSGIGEIALLRRSPRTATVLARTDVRGYCVDAGTFLAAISGAAAGAQAERMAEANLARAGRAGLGIEPGA